MRPRLPFHRGDQFRCPRASSRWHTVARCYRRRSDGALIVAVRASRWYRLLTGRPVIRMEFHRIEAMGYLVRRKEAA